MVRRGRVVLRAIRADALPPSPWTKRAERMGMLSVTRPPLLGSVCVILSVATTSPRGSMGNTRARYMRSPTSSSRPGSMARLTMLW
jgi:hypothetical protein